MINLISIC